MRNTDKIKVEEICQLKKLFEKLKCQKVTSFTSDFGNTKIAAKNMNGAYGDEFLTKIGRPATVLENVLYISSQAQQLLAHRENCVKNILFHDNTLGLENMIEHLLSIDKDAIKCDSVIA